MSDGAAVLRQAFAQAGRPLFVPYVMGGFPSLAESRAQAETLARHADILELGIPFSDPLADGPTIQAAGQRALEAGTRPEDVIEIAAGLRGGPPIVLMTYVNTILAAGERAFFEHAARAGVAGVIVPDLPVDEAEPAREAAARAGVAIIALAAPTTDTARMAAIGRVAEGFLYCVSVTGVTGGEISVGEELEGFIARVRAGVDVPLVVGFGVRTPEHASRIGGIADGVVIASQLIRLYDEAPDSDEGLRALDRYAASIVEALQGAAWAAGSAPRRGERAD
jgi:tryptophan synthase alpha chain